MYSIVKKLIVKSQATATQAAQSSVKKLEHRFFDVSKAATTSASSMSPGPAVPRSTNANPGVLDGRKYPLRPFLPFTRYAIYSTLSQYEYSKANVMLAIS